MKLKGEEGTSKTIRCFFRKNVRFIFCPKNHKDVKKFLS